MNNWIKGMNINIQHPYDGQNRKKLDCSLGELLSQKYSKSALMNCQKMRTNACK